MGPRKKKENYVLLGVPVEYSSAKQAASMEKGRVPCCMFLTCLCHVELRLFKSAVAARLTVNNTQSRAGWRKSLTVNNTQSRAGCRKSLIVNNTQSRAGWRKSLTVNNTQTRAGWRKLLTVNNIQPRAGWRKRLTAL